MHCNHVTYIHKEATHQQNCYGADSWVAGQFSTDLGPNKQADYIKFCLIESYHNNFIQFHVSSKHLYSLFILYTFMLWLCLGNMTKTFYVLNKDLNFDRKLSLY